MYSTEYIKNILKYITEYTRIYVIRTPPMLIRNPPAPHLHVRIDNYRPVGQLQTPQHRILMPLR